MLTRHPDMCGNSEEKESHGGGRGADGWGRGAAHLGLTVRKSQQVTGDQKVDGVVKS